MTPVHSQMTSRILSALGLGAEAPSAAGPATHPTGGPVPDPALEAALSALKSYEWGRDPAPLAAIDLAVKASHVDPAARGKLEGLLAAALEGPLPHAAVLFVCERLGRIGSAASVPALAALLPREDLAHVARAALEHIPGPESLAALRRSLSDSKGRTRVGAIRSLGARGDLESLSTIAPLLADASSETAEAAAWALGRMGSKEAVDVLVPVLSQGPEGTRAAAADACLQCAQALLASGKRAEAIRAIEQVRDAKLPDPVHRAALLALEGLPPA